MTAPLTIGADRTDLPLPLPIRLAGFAARAADGPTDRVLAPLRLRTLALGTDHDQPVVLVSADLLFWGDDVADLIKDQFEAEFGIGRDHLILHATHTHSGPQAGRRFLPALGEPDDRFLDLLIDTTLASAKRALAGQDRVTIERSSIMVPLGVDRRHARTGGAHPLTEIDHEATVIRFRTEAGDCAALLVQHACHPVLHHDNAITSDFSGAAMSALEDDGAGVALYLQGCCGDVNPDHYRGVEFLGADQPAIEEFGGRLAAAVGGLLSHGDWRAEAPAVTVSEHPFEVPVPDRIPIEELRGLADRDDARGEWARLMLADPDRHAGPVTVRLTRLTLTESTRFIGLSAELVTRFGRYTKERSGGAAITLGYTNGMTGYLITAEQVAQGGYEPAESPYYFGMPGRFDPSIEDVVLAELDRAL
ncbi:hypothetical protein [Microlunatus speluncae]|uniref:hypothetical protein n=1 Tax=Microlunatus speluncae TaxID=2594267 RepID=UPI00126612C6|nr:hypothetical protein [Microlunatus speluncae]